VAMKRNFTGQYFIASHTKTIYIGCLPLTLPK
jgi:hypothetical protein